MAYQIEEIGALERRAEVEVPVEVVVEKGGAGRHGLYNVILLGAARHIAQMGAGFALHVDKLHCKVSAFLRVGATRCGSGIWAASGRERGQDDEW